MVDFLALNARSGNLRALCGICVAFMHRRARRDAVAAVMPGLALHMGEAPHRGGLRRGAAELSAFEHLAQGRALFRSYEPGVNEAALAHFAAAIEADPSLGVAHSYHGMADLAIHDYNLVPIEVLHRARDQGLRGAWVSPDESRCHGLLSLIHGWLAEFGLAEEAACRAVELNPCDANALCSLSVALLIRGDPQGCLDRIELAKDLSPMWPAHYDGEHSFALFHLSRYEESARLLSRLPWRSARQEMRLAATQALMGEREVARRHAALARSLAPGQDFVALARTRYPYEHDRDRQPLIDGIELALRMAREATG